LSHFIFELYGFEGLSLVMAILALIADF